MSFFLSVFYLSLRVSCFFFWGVVGGAQVRIIDRWKRLTSDDGHCRVIHDVTIAEAEILEVTQTRLLKNFVHVHGLLGWVDPPVVAHVDIEVEVIASNVQDPQGPRLNHRPGGRVFGVDVPKFIGDERVEKGFCVLILDPQLPRCKNESFLR